MRGPPSAVCRRLVGLPVPRARRWRGSHFSVGVGLFRSLCEQSHTATPHALPHPPARAGAPIPVELSGDWSVRSCVGRATPHAPLSAAYHSPCPYSAAASCLPSACRAASPPC
eukprot:7295937-Prymnesium_polylepis.2